MLLCAILTNKKFVIPAAKNNVFVKTTISFFTVHCIIRIELDMSN